MLPSPESPAKQPSTRASFTWAVFGNIIYAATQWGILVSLAQLASTETVGQFTYALAVTAPVMLLLTGRNVQATDTQSRHSTLDYLEHRLVGCAIALAATLAIAHIISTEPSTRAAILWVGALKALELVLDIGHGLFHQKNRLDIISQSLALRGIVGLVAFFASYLISASLPMAIIGLMLAWLLAAAAFDLPRARQLAPGILRERGGSGRLAKITRETFPLGLATALYSLVPNIPRFVVESHLGYAKLGVFAALAYFLVAARTISGASTNVLMPRLAGFWTARNLEKFRQSTRRATLASLAFSAVVALLAWLIGPEVVGLVYGGEYARERTLLVLLAVAGGTQQVGAVLTAALSAAQSFRILTWANAFALVITTVSIYPLVARFGLNGAGACVCLAMLAPLGLKAVALRRLAIGAPAGGGESSTVVAPEKLS